jgi:hypothetical protein
MRWCKHAHEISVVAKRTNPDVMELLASYLAKASLNSKTQTLKLEALGGHHKSNKQWSSHPPGQMARCGGHPAGHALIL